VTLSGHEQLVYACEVHSTNLGEFAYSQILEKIRLEINIKHGVSPYIVILVSPRSIDKTTSGKIARQWVKKAFVKGSLKEIKSWRSLGAVGTDGGVNVISEDIDSFVPLKVHPSKNIPKGFTVQAPAHLTDNNTEEGEKREKGEIGEIGQIETSTKVYDPTIMSMEDVLKLLQIEVCEVLEVEHGKLDPNLIDVGAPLPAIGLDSLLGIQVS